MSRVPGRRLASACSVYQFDITGQDGVEWDPLVIGTGGPGLGWEFALNDAIRQHCQRRGDIGWRTVRKQAMADLPIGTIRGLILAHVEVKTTRHVEPMTGPYGYPRGNRGNPDVLAIVVRRVQHEEEDDDDAITA